MNCDKAQRWLSRRLDGELSPGRDARLQAHLADCPACRELESAWRALGVSLNERKIPTGPAAEAAWLDVRRAIRAGEAGPQERAPDWIFGSRWQWAFATLTLLLVVGGGWWVANRPDARARLARQPATEVEWVETDLPGATPMVYRDEETGCTVIWIVEAEEAKDDHAG